jgi:hypothetical protein
MPSEDDLYQLSLKAYRDNKNTMDYAVKVAAEAARQEVIATGNPTRISTRISTRDELRQRLNLPGR